MNLIYPALLLTLMACGKAPDTPQFFQTEAEEMLLPLDGSNVEGLYMARFITLNPHVNGTIPGSVTLLRKDDRVLTYVRLFGGGPKVWHQQFITQGKRCPTLADDVNGDGFIDIEEGRKVWGETLIPLDADLSSQDSGRNIYPVADESGSYFYERITSWNKLFGDLKREDKNTDDNVMKLAPDEGLAIKGRVAVVLGVAQEKELPETVAGEGRLKNWQTLPVTCGVFEEIERTPGERYDGEIPGPVADVDPDQDRPDNDGLSLPDDYTPDDWRDSRDGEGRYTPRRDNPEREESWEDRVIEWWRSRWNSWRRGRD